MNRYPIGDQTFEKVISRGFFYIDKTDYVYKLVNSGSYYFLSRPRRFGKRIIKSLRLKERNLHRGNQI